MFHPDGLILATGTEDNLIRVWDLKSLKNVATFRGHKGAITDLKVNLILIPNLSFGRHIHHIYLIFSSLKMDTF